MKQISNWTEKETEFLTKNYKNLTDEVIGNTIGRSCQAIERKRARLGLKKNRNKFVISPERENEIINSKLTYQEIAQKYNISREQARNVFRKNSVKDYVAATNLWTPEEEQYLMKNFKVKGDKKIADELGRTAASVLKKRVKMGLNRKDFHLVDNPPDRFWDEVEIEHLVTNIDVLTYDELAINLNRTVKAVMIKASRLGLVTSGSKWSKKEDELVAKYRHKTLDELAFLLERSKKAIKHRVSKLGIELDNKRFSDLELKIERILKDLKVKYKSQIILGSDFNYKADFVIGKIVIEANGDYWHGNPILYPVPNEMQKLAIEKDKIKKHYFKELGFEVYEIWESEVEDDFVTVKRKIARLLGNQ